MKTRHIKINENVYDFSGPIYDGDNDGSAKMIASNAQGENAFAEGDNTTASGDNSHSEGTGTTASGAAAHTEGNGTAASGAASHAEGTSSTASGTSSHAEGGSCTASADNAHAEGYRCTAKHSGAHVEGGYQESGTAYQHTQGRYAKALASPYIDIVGWGDDGNNRKNVSVLDTSGNLIIKGKLYQDASNDECTSGTLVSAILYRHNILIEFDPGLGLSFYKNYITIISKNNTQMDAAALAAYLYNQCSGIRQPAAGNFPDGGMNAAQTMNISSSAGTNIEFYGYNSAGYQTNTMPYSNFVITDTIVEVS